MKYNRGGFDVAEQRRKGVRVKITISKENYLKTIAEAESEGETVIAATARALAADYASRGDRGPSSFESGRSDPGRQGRENLADQDRAATSPTVCCIATT